MNDDFLFRYNEDFLKRAAKRRELLSYNSLHIGNISNKDIDKVSKLLYQMHQNYYFENWVTCVALSGILLEQTLNAVLSEALNDGVEILDRDLRKIDSVNDMMLRNLIDCALRNKFLDYRYKRNILELNRVRNCVVHNSLGNFFPDGRVYKASIHKGFSVEIEKSEVENSLLGKESDEIWAYYCLTRTRMLIDKILEKRLSNHPPINLEKK